MQLRQYQIDGLQAIRELLARGSRAPILVAPTGSGKTVCAAEIIRSATSKGKRVLFVAHRQELIAQAANKLAGLGIAHGVIAQPTGVRQMQVDQYKTHGRAWVDQAALVRVGMVQTIANRLEVLLKAPPDIVIIDECHLSISPTYANLFAALPNAVRIGLTATPVRLSGEGMSEHYDSMHVLAQPLDLLADGVLAPIRIFAGREMPDLAGVSRRCGELAAGEVAAAMDKPTLIGDAVEHYARLTPGLRAIVFCAGVQHAHNMAGQFMAAGYRASAVDGDSNPEDRALAVKQLASGDLDVLCNCGLYIEGLDCPSIEVVIDCAPTLSLTRALQKIGRGARTSAATGKKCLWLLDHAGNVLRHGHPYSSRDWSLEGTKRAAKQDGPDVPLMTCPKCFAITSPAPVCPVCGHEIPRQERRGPEQVGGELVEIDASAIEEGRREARQAQGKAHTLQELMDQGMSRARALHILKARADKDALIAAAMEHTRRHGGPSPAEVKRMRPAELRKLIDAGY